MKLTRPLVFFDLETTGTNILQDRIVEISLLKVFPGEETPKTYSKRVNPGIPIPPEASNVHHITDEDVKEAPRFSEIAQGIADTFKGCDIAGFNSNKFDLPLLLEEMSRAHVLMDISDAHLVDVQNIFHKKEPRNLIAAYKFYCGKDLTAAHSATADTEATYEVFMAQLSKYDDLPDTVEELAQFSNLNRNVDLTGKFIYNDRKEIVINFGQHKGKLLSKVLVENPSYYDWMLSKDFPMDTKRVLQRVYNSLKR